MGQRLLPPRYRLAGHRPGLKTGNVPETDRNTEIDKIRSIGLTGWQ